MKIDVQLLASRVAAEFEGVSSARIGYVVAEFSSVVAYPIIEEGRAARLVSARIYRSHRIAITRKPDQRLTEVLRGSGRKTESGGSPRSPAEIEVLHIG